MGGTAQATWAEYARAVVQTDDDRLWLGVALGVGLVVYLSYLVTHTYPAYGAGLFMQITEEISTNGYALPERIPGYTRGGVPFAYPPLLFYVAAVVRGLFGVGPIDYSLHVPGLFVLAYLVPYYFTAKELLGTARLAGLSASLFAVTPAVLQWHLSAGGMVRSAAMLFALAGTYTGLRFFRSGETRWVVPSAVLFGLTVLSHPTYTVFFGLTYLLLFAQFDRTLRGFVQGALIAGSGIALAAPWWVQVGLIHGPDIFTAAAGTHSGLAGGMGRFLSEFVYPLDPSLEAMIFIAAYAGAAYALVRRRWFLPVWLVVVGFVVGKHRFQFVAGSMLTALLIAEVVLPRVHRWARRRAISRSLLTEVTVLAMVVVAAATLGAAFAASELATHAGSTTQPAFIDDHDREAMKWAAAYTDPDAGFVVLGDAAEWFPLLSDRTILVGPWGVEWTSPERYYTHLELYKGISDCPNAACIDAYLGAEGFTPQYVYIPKGHYTVRGFDHYQDDRMRASLAFSDRYEITFENAGVMIVKVVGPSPEIHHLTA